MTDPFLKREIDVCTFTYNIHKNNLITYNGFNKNIELDNSIISASRYLEAKNILTNVCVCIYKYE